MLRLGVAGGREERYSEDGAEEKPQPGTSATAAATGDCT